jgi:ABC-type proline/glycine betaine transport system permease subunit
MLNLNRGKLMQPKMWQVLFWPPVIDPKYRKSAIWMGCFAAFFYAVNWGLIMLAGPIIYIFETHKTETLYTSLQGLIYFIIAASIGWGIYKRYKLATITGLALAIIGLIGNWIAKGFTARESILFLLMIFMFVHSTRGIFAHHETSNSLESETMEKV